METLIPFVAFLALAGAGVVGFRVNNAFVAGFCTFSSGMMFESFLRALMQ